MLGLLSTLLFSNYRGPKDRKKTKNRKQPTNQPNKRKASSARTEEEGAELLLRHGGMGLTAQPMLPPGLSFLEFATPCTT